MSLEEALNRNSDMLEKQNSLLEKMLASAGSALAGASSDDAPKRGRGKAKDKDDDTTESSGKANDEDARGAIVELVGKWVKEVEGDTAEFEARRNAALAAFKKLEGAAGDTISSILKAVPASQFERIEKWIAKQKAADNGFGVGRLTAVPKDESASSDDEI